MARFPMLPGSNWRRTSPFKEESLLMYVSSRLLPAVAAPMPATTGFCSGSSDKTTNAVPWHILHFVSWVKPPCLVILHRRPRRISRKHSSWDQSLASAPQLPILGWNWIMDDNSDMRQHIWSLFYSALRCPSFTQFSFRNYFQLFVGNAAQGWSIAGARGCDHRWRYIQICSFALGVRVSASGCIERPDAEVLLRASAAGGEEKYLVRGTSGADSGQDEAMLMQSS